MRAIRVSEHDNGLRLGHYEPGNGTSYRAIAVPWNIDEYQQALGTVSDGWLVVSCNTARAYLFQRGGFLLDEYIAKHLGGGEGDYPHLGDVVRTLLARPGPGPGPGPREEMP